MNASISRLLWRKRAGGYNAPMADSDKKAKFNFDELKSNATSADITVRKRAFVDYFERFDEFPSYLFDNSNGIDAQLYETIKAVQRDPETNDKIQKGLQLLLDRLPAHES